MWRIADSIRPQTAPEAPDDDGLHGFQPDELVSGAPEWLAAHASFFDSGRPVLLARAPGRLDVMGGFADYSGSLVLEYPIGLATWVAAQPGDGAPGARAGSGCLVIESTRVPALQNEGEAPVADEASASRVAIPLDELTPAGGALSYDQARHLLTADHRRSWAAYVAGALVVLHRERGRRLPADGAKVLIHSNLPTGIGLSSSAALGVAAFEVLAALTDTVVDDRELALLSQKVENLVVGAPCGVMDQLTVVSGRSNHLLEILCQPAEVRGHIPLPPTLEMWALGSGIRHAVSGADYGSVRAATFMGYRIVAELAGLPVANTNTKTNTNTTTAPSQTVGAPAPVVVTDTLFGGYLANVSASLWHSRLRDHIPRQLDGAAFLARYGGSPDQVTRIDPARHYAVRACTEHPILEHDRVRRFRDLVREQPDQRILGELGALMYASHASYSACGVGSAGTDRLVELVRATGAGGGLYGAKITGGGSGGAVAVLARRGSAEVIKEIAARYQAETGLRCLTIAGSSPGARVFGLRHLVPV